MPFVTTNEPEIVSARRVLIQGPPNSFKTTSLLTWPRPAHYVCCPGELGSATVPRGLADLKTYVWQDEAKEAKSLMVVNQVETLLWEILGGKHGPCESLLIDGWHKYYNYVLDWITGGAYFKGEEFEPRLYARSHEHFRYTTQRLNASLIPHVVYTAWDGREADKPGVRGGPSHVYPNFPGKMAKEIMGEFSVVVYSMADYTTRQPNKPARALWQLIPAGEVWGAAIKCPPDVMLHIPGTCDQSFEVLQHILKLAYAKAQGAAT